MKKSLEAIINKLLAKVEIAPLYDPVPLEPEVGPGEVEQKGGGRPGERGCGYSVVGMGDPNYLWGGREPGSYNSTVNHSIAYGDCPLCRGSSPPAFCACIAAYSNPCYNWHWSNGTGGLNPDQTRPTWDPPAYSSYPSQCPSREELEGPGYSEEEWMGNPETLTGQRYRWWAWDYLTKIRHSDGTWSPGQYSPLNDSISGYGSENPLDPEALASTNPRITMRQLWAQFESMTSRRPTLMQRKILESGCNGNPGQQTGSCCIPGVGLGGNECVPGLSPEDCAARGGGWSSQSCSERGDGNCSPSKINVDSNEQALVQELMKKAKSQLLKRLKESRTR
jgi:hypothetical protein